MKNTYLIVLLLFLFNYNNHYSQSLTDSNDLNKIPGIQGKVKSIKEIAYQAEEKFGEILRGKRKRDYRLLGSNGPVRPKTSNPLGLTSTDFKIIFNKLGFKKSQEFYGENFQLIKKHIYKYRRDSILIQSISYKNDSIYRDRFYKYDRNGLRTESFDSITLKKTTYKYDQNSNQIRLTSFQSNGSISSMSKKEYDNSNNLVLSMSYYSTGELSSMTGYKYDLKGKKIESINYSTPNKKVKGKSKFIYDEKMELIGIKSYDINQNLKSITDYIQKPNGKRIELYSYFINNYKLPLWKIEFDSFGNQNVYTDYNPQGEIMTEWQFQYEFDKHNNWIKKIGFENNIPRYILIREIKYFK